MMPDLPDQYYLWLPFYWQREWLHLGAAWLAAQIGLGVLALLWSARRARPQMDRADYIILALGAALALGLVTLGLYYLLVAPAAA